MTLVSPKVMQQELIKIAREVADKDKVDPVNSQGDMITLFPEELMRLIDRVQAQEREACVKLLEDLPHHTIDVIFYTRRVKEAIEAIRARGEV